MRIRYNKNVSPAVRIFIYPEEFDEIDNLNLKIKEFISQWSDIVNLGDVNFDMEYTIYDSKETIKDEDLDG